MPEAHIRLETCQAHIRPETCQAQIKLETCQAHVRLETHHARSSRKIKGDVMPPWQHIWQPPEAKGRYLVAWERGGYSGNP